MELAVAADFIRSLKLCPIQRGCMNSLPDNAYPDTQAVKALLGCERQAIHLTEVLCIFVGSTLIQYFNYLQHPDAKVIH